MSKWHLEADDGTYRPACGRKADLVVSQEEFKGRIASDRCKACEAILRRRQALAQ